MSEKRVFYTCFTLMIIAIAIANPFLLMGVGILWMLYGAIKLT